MAEASKVAHLETEEDGRMDKSLVEGKDGKIKTYSNQEQPPRTFVPFKYYATTGEAESVDFSPMGSDKEKSVWDKKMDEARFLYFVENDFNTFNN